MYNPNLYKDYPFPPEMSDFKMDKELEDGLNKAIEQGQKIANDWINSDYKKEIERNFDLEQGGNND